MSDSTEDLKNIDSYGVWVKRPPQDAEGITEDAATEPTINAEEVPIEEPVIPEDLSFDTLTDNDSTLSDEEVSNIKSDISEPETKSDSADDFFKDELPDFSNIGTTEPAKTETEDSSESEISLDDFIGAEGFDDPNKAFEPKTETAEKTEEKPAEPAAQEESVDASSFEDGELSLDDFMDGGFSDSGSSAPAGNSGSDEISLDDFFDDDTSSTKEDDVSNDEPLDIDLSFTENPDDKVPTEETDISADDEDSNAFAEDDMFDNISAEQAENNTKPSENSAGQDLDTTTEKVSLDDFGIDENSDDATAVAAGASVNSQADSEEVDLSDFGIDSEAGETPVKQDVHASKKKVVDYDIAITDDDSVQEAPKAEEVVTSEPKETPEEDKNSVKVDSSMLDMIMQELSGLKNQINSLRDEFQTIKESKNEIQPEQKVEKPAEETQEIPEAAIPAEKSEQENTGFFDGNDNDETIALSGDELSNIMNTADITESTEETPEQDSGEIPEEISETSVPETAEISEPAEEISDEPQVETEKPADFVKNEEISIPEETSGNIETIEPTEELSEPETIPEETENSEQPAAETEKPAENAENFNDESPFGTIDETNSLEEEPDSGLSMNSDEEKLEEPNLDEINMKNMEEEISIPKVDDLADDVDTPLDDILVESSNSDLINSVDEKEVPAPEMPETTEETESVEPAEEIAEPEEIPSAETEISEESENSTEENLSEEENKIYEDFIAEDPKVSESISAENIDYLNEDKSDSDDVEKTEEIEEAEAIPEAEPEIAPESEEPELAETIEPEETDSTEEIPSTTEADTNNKQLPDDLKNDVKSVLLYMDQLLENLPEDKIMEFAKSEQFTTYKKLFSELGLAK